MTEMMELSERTLKAIVNVFKSLSKIMNTMKLWSSEKEFYTGKRYQEASIAPLPEMIALTCLYVHILSTFQSSGQI